LALGYSWRWCRHVQWRRVHWDYTSRCQRGIGGDQFQTHCIVLSQRMCSALPRPVFAMMTQSWIDSSICKHMPHGLLHIVPKFTLIIEIQRTKRQRLIHAALHSHVFNLWQASASNALHCPSNDTTHDACCSFVDIRIIDEVCRWVW